MSKIKILHIITYLPIGGAQDNTLITVENLDRNKYDVSLLCAPRGEWVDRVLSIKNLRVIFIDELIRRIHLFYDLIAFIKIFRFIKKEKFTIVHTHSSKPGFSGRIAAKLAGVPIVVHTIHGFPFHDFMSPLTKNFFIFIERFLSKFSDILITVSKLNLNKAVQLKLDKPEKFVNIYSGICFDKFKGHFDKNKIKKELGIQKDYKVIGMIGRLSEQKAPQYLIQAIPSVIQKFPKSRFLLVGDGELRKELETLVKKFGIDEYVRFLGYRENIPEIMSIFDIFVLTSLWEGLGRSLTEALYMEVPVVATAVEGVPELIQNGKTGMLVPPKDIKAISNGILQLLQNPSMSKKMGKKGHTLVVNNFSANKMVQEIDNLYQNSLL